MLARGEKRQVGFHQALVDVRRKFEDETFAVPRDRGVGMEKGRTDAELDAECFVGCAVFDLKFHVVACFGETEMIQRIVAHAIPIDGAQAPHPVHAFLGRGRVNGDLAVEPRSVGPIAVGIAQQLERAAELMDGGAGDVAGFKMPDLAVAQLPGDARS